MCVSTHAPSVWSLVLSCEYLNPSILPSCWFLICCLTMLARVVIGCYCLWCLGHIGILTGSMHHQLSCRGKTKSQACTKTTIPLVGAGWTWDKHTARWCRQRRVVSWLDVETGVVEAIWNQTLYGGWGAGKTYMNEENQRRREPFFWPQTPDPSMDPLRVLHRLAPLHCRLAGDFLAWGQHNLTARQCERW